MRTRLPLIAARRAIAACRPPPDCLRNEIGVLSTSRGPSKSCQVAARGSSPLFLFSTHHSSRCFSSEHGLARLLTRASAATIRRDLAPRSAGHVLAPSSRKAGRRCPGPRGVARSRLIASGGSTAEPEQRSPSSFLRVVFSSSSRSLFADKRRLFFCSLASCKCDPRCTSLWARAIA